MTGINIGIGSIVAMKLGNTNEQFHSSDEEIIIAKSKRHLEKIDCDSLNFDDSYTCQREIQSQGTLFYYNCSCENISELGILRVGCCIGLVSAILFNVLPLIMPNTYKINEKNNVDRMISGNNCEYGFSISNINTWWNCYISKLDHTVWYMTLIPFCFYTCCSGMINPPATVILLEPYPDMAGIMAGISTVVTYAFSYSFVIVLTHVVNDNLSRQPFIIHLVCGVCGVLLCIISCVMISKKQMQLRMNSSTY